MAARKTKLAVDWIVTTTGHGSVLAVFRSSELQNGSSKYKKIPRSEEFQN